MMFAWLEPLPRPMLQTCRTRSAA